VLKKYPFFSKWEISLSGFWFNILIPILAVITALFISSIAILLSGGNPILAYTALASGSFGSMTSIVETIIKATPLMISGLGVAIAFRGGLFNIGVEGQMFVGSIAAVIIGTKFHLPTIYHIPLSLVAGAAAGGAWAAIPGYLKSKTGASEVITTIMTNYIALRIITWSIGATGPLRKVTSVVPETDSLFITARLPSLIANTRLHVGFLIALILAVLVYLFLFYSPLGIEIRTVGSNSWAANYVGIHVNRIIVITMSISGAFAGIAGAIQVMGLPPYNFTTGFNVGYGFDSLAVAVLGNIHPVGVVFASLLFGAMNAGARLMQLRAKVSSDMISIIQSLILLFVAANQIVKRLYHIQTKQKDFQITQEQLEEGK